MLDGALLARRPVLTRLFGQVESNVAAPAALDSGVKVVLRGRPSLEAVVTRLLERVRQGAVGFLSLVDVDGGSKPLSDRYEPMAGETVAVLFQP